MNIAAIQTDLIWENPDINRFRLSKIIDDLDGDIMMVILPEMFTTGFSMNSSVLCETMDGKTINWMRLLSKKNKLVITGSLIIEENGNFFNRLIFMKPDGNYSYYDKGHLFRMESENLHFKRGTRQVIDRWSGFNISLQICYDLRFPVWSRNRSNSSLCFGYTQI